MKYMHETHGECCTNVFIINSPLYDPSPFWPPFFWCQQATGELSEIVQKLLRIEMLQGL